MEGRNFGRQTVLQAKRGLLMVRQGIRIPPDHKAGVRMGYVYDFRVKLLFVPQVVVGG